MRKAANRMLEGAREALAFARGELTDGVLVHVPDHIEIRDLRHRLGMSQAQFARRFGFDVRTLQDWEQGRQRPTGPTRAYLKVIEREPEAVQRALAP